MAKCQSCTQGDLDSLGFNESMTCGFYSTSGTYLGSKVVTKVSGGFLYGGDYVPTVPDACAEPLDVSSGLGE